MNVNIGLGDDQKWYKQSFLLEYAKNNKNDLLQTVEGGIIVSNWSGWLTVVSSTNCIYHAWAGEVDLI